MSSILPPNSFSHRRASFKLEGGSFHAIWGLFPGTCLSFFFGIFDAKKNLLNFHTQNRRNTMKHPEMAPKPLPFRWLLRGRPLPRLEPQNPENSTGFSGSFFWGKANNKSRENKKRGGRYIDIFILQINFCLVEHGTANTALKQIFHQLPLTVSTHFSNLWGAAGWERSEHNPLPTVASLPNFELLIRSNMGTFPSKREMKNSFIKEALFISYRQYIIPNTGFI